jgi:hypothetical protein
VNCNRDFDSINQDMLKIVVYDAEVKDDAMWDMAMGATNSEVIKKSRLYKDDAVKCNVGCGDGRDEFGCKLNFRYCSSF